MCLWFVAHLYNEQYLLLLPDIVVLSRTWQVSVSFFLILLSLLSSANLSHSSSRLSHLPSAASTVSTLMDHRSSLASLISPTLQAVSLLCLLLKHTILMSKSASWKLSFLSFLPILTSLPLLLTIPLSVSFL